MFYFTIARINNQILGNKLNRNNDGAADMRWAFLPDINAFRSYLTAVLWRGLNHANNAIRPNSP